MKKKYRNNVFQRIIAMILAVVLAFTMLPPTVITHAETKKSIKISVTDAETGQILPVSIISNIEIKNATDGEFGIDDSENIKVWDCKDNEIRLVTKKRKTGVSKHNKIVVYIPENYKFNKVDIKCGAGNLWIDDNINADKMDIECGAGNVEMSDIEVKDASVECGAGNIYLKGDISGNIKAECGVGNVELHVNREKEYYNYSVECALGNIDINDNEYGGFATERKINNDSDYTMDIECAMGNVTIQTIN